MEAMRTVPARGQLKIAQSLAGSAGGAETLLALVEKRQASPQVLLDRGVQDRFKAQNSAELKEKHAKLVENLEPPSEAIQKQIETLRTKFATAKGSAVDGAQVFTKNCAICHQIDGNGTLIGPQLDGIGGRGLERILEDTLDPNRNVDVSFRTHIIVLKEGDVVSGLFRREEGELLVLADSTGKEITHSEEGNRIAQRIGDVADAGELRGYYPREGFPGFGRVLDVEGSATRREINRRKKKGTGYVPCEIEGRLLAPDDLAGTIAEQIAKTLVGDQLINH